MKSRPGKLLRLALWLGVAYTANANRKHFGLPTTWVFHITLNSFFLFLPELVEGAAQVFRLDPHPKSPNDLVSTAYGALDDAVVKNPRYAFYVAPVALAYIVSHPEFNIYKGRLAELRFLGFGLDAIPHSLTAFGFTNLIMDGLEAFRQHTPRGARWHLLARQAERNSSVVAGSLLVAASALYEGGEYAIHNEELRETGGDVSKINLVWSAQDTIFDIMSNTLGWLTGILVRRRSRRVPHASFASRRTAPAAIGSKSKGNAV